MGSFRGALENLTADLRYELDVAWQQVVQQGNIYPLIEFYNKHEAKLQQDYNISLNELLGFDPYTPSSTPSGNNNNNNTPTVNVRGANDVKENPLSGLIFERPQKSKGAFSIISILALSAGVFLIIKSLKK